MNKALQHFGELDPQLLNKLLKKDLEWGKNLGVPLIKKGKSLIKGFHSVIQLPLCQYVEQTHNEIQSHIWDALIHKTFDQNELLAFTQQNYPWVDLQNLLSIYGETCYVVWRETGEYPKYPTNLLCKKAPKSKFQIIFGLIMVIFFLLVCFMSFLPILKDIFAK